MEKAKILALLLSFLLTSCYENTQWIMNIQQHTWPTNTTCAPS